VFDVLGDPVRRRLLELLADGQAPAGELSAAVRAEFGISQPAVSQHLKVLRENGFATVRVDGARRLYSLDADPLLEVDAWLERYRVFWEQRLDALDTEVRRGKHRRLGVVDGLDDVSRRLAQGGRRDYPLLSTSAWVPSTVSRARRSASAVPGSAV